MTRQSLTQQALGLLGWLAVVFAAGALGAVASVRAASFYAFLSQPSWAPPAWLFGPVWTVLYGLMAIAAWLVWRERGFRGASGALTLFIAQLALNALWTWIFFAWHRGALALLEIVVLWLLVAATMVAFWRWHRLAAALLLPYLAWVGFATALTYSLWRMNPAQLG
ncbi:MAG: TspO/MBR family protein [Burkholderiaceae bacterium]